MNLLLGISLPLASQQKNFFKVSARLLNQNDFNPLRCQGILKHFALQSKVVKPLSLQSDFIDKNLNINDGFIKKNNTGPLKQKIGLNPNEISLFGLRNKQCKKIGEFICAVSFKASLNCVVDVYNFVKSLSVDDDILVFDCSKNAEAFSFTVGSIVIFFSIPYSFILF